MENADFQIINLCENLYKKIEVEMSIFPEGEDLRKAVKWISAERMSKPSIQIKALVEQASLQFNLSPKKTDFLLKYVKDEKL